MPRRSYAETPGCGLRIHIILQAASVFGAATVIDLYLRDVLALGSGDVKVCAIIWGGVIPCLFGFFGGRYADAKLGPYRGQRMAYCFSITGALQMLASTVSEDELRLSITLTRTIGMIGMTFSSIAAGIMLPCIVTYLGDQHSHWDDTPRDIEPKQKCRGGWCCCCFRCCCRRRIKRTKKRKGARTNETEGVELEAINVLRAGRSEHHRLGGGDNDERGQNAANRPRLSTSSAEGPVLTFCLWASIGALLGNTGYPMAIQRLSTAVAVLKSYPVPGGCYYHQRKPIQCVGPVDGTITVAETREGIEMFGTVKSEELTSGTYHIHEGSKCGDEHTGGHYAPLKSHGHDAWGETTYDVGDSKEGSATILSKEIKHFSLVGKYPVEGRVVVVHDEDGSRISCGNIATTYHEYKWSIMLLLVLLIQIAGLCAFSCGRGQYKQSRPTRWDVINRGAIFTATERSDLSFVLPTLLPVPIFWAIYGQQVAAWEAQAESLNRSWDDSLNYIPQSWQFPDAMSAFRRLSVVAMVVCYRCLIFPVLRGARVLVCSGTGIFMFCPVQTFHPENVGNWWCMGSALSRMGWASILLLASILCSKKLQKAIDGQPEYDITGDDYDDRLKSRDQYLISVKYQIPQTILLSLSETLVVTAGLTYCYDEMEPSLRATVEGVWWMLYFGQLIGSLTIDIYPSRVFGYDAGAVASACVALCFFYIASVHTFKAERLMRAHAIAEASDHIPEDRYLIEDTEQPSWRHGLYESDFASDEDDEDDEFIFRVGGYYNNPMTVENDNRNFDFQFERAAANSSSDDEEEAEAIDIDPRNVSVVVDGVAEEEGESEVPEAQAIEYKTVSMGQESSRSAGGTSGTGRSKSGGSPRRSFFGGSAAVALTGTVTTGQESSRSAGGSSRSSSGGSPRRSFTEYKREASYDSDGDEKQEAEVEARNETQAEVQPEAQAQAGAEEGVFYK